MITVFMRANLAAIRIQVSAAIHAIRAPIRKEVEFDPVTEIAGRSCETTMGDDHKLLEMRR
jgi:hypothetical protein